MDIDVDEYRNNLFISSKLNDLKKDLFSDPINLNAVRSNLETLRKLGKQERITYLEDLLDPKNRKNVKIPSENVVPSCTFQQKVSFQVTTLLLAGFRVMVINPFMLISNNLAGVNIEDIRSIEEFPNPGFVRIQQQRSFAVASFSASGSRWKETKWQGVADFQIGIPDVYSSYRLVSAEINFRYKDVIEQAQGILGGGVLFKEWYGFGSRLEYQRPNGNTYTTDSLITDLDGTFEYLDNVPNRLLFYKEYNLLDGLRFIYFPLDNRFTEFKKVLNTTDGLYAFSTQTTTRYLPSICIKPEYTTSGFNWVIYINGARKNPMVKFDMECFFNFEVIPKPELLNYIPIELNPFKMDGKKKRVLLKKLKEELQDKVVTKLNKNILDIIFKKNKYK